MAWIAPRTWVTGETVTAALMNTHVRDNLLETAVAKATGAGQVPYATGANALAMLAAVARRMPRFDAAATALETVANLSLAQVPLFASAASVNSATTITDIVTRAITTTGGIVLIFGWAKISADASVVDTVIQSNLSLYRDTTSLQAPLPNMATNSGVTGGTDLGNPQPFVYLETPAAGSYTYKLRGFYVLNVGTLSGTPLAEGAIMVCELAA